MKTRRYENQAFDTSTVDGLRQSERYQEYLYGKYESVTVRPIGLNRVIVIGLRPSGK